MAEQKPQILVVQLGDEMQTSIFSDLYSVLQNKIEEYYELVKKTTAHTVIDSLSQSDTQPKAVLVVDGGVSKQKFRKVQTQLCSYAKHGGTVILCCLFSSFVSTPDFIALAGNMDLAWEWGDYHRTVFALNPAFRPVFGYQAFGTLQRSYSMKTVHLKHVDPAAKIYVPTDASHTQSAVFPPTAVDKAQCPAVLQKHGEGFIGFIGDVNNENGTQSLLMAILGTVVKDTSGEDAITSGLDPGCVVCGEVTPVKKCSGCKQIQYCSVKCQKADWKYHKQLCHAI